MVETINNWKRYPENKPSQMSCCLVYNERGSLDNGKVRAIYYPDQDMFQLYDTNVRDLYPLSVTHYFEIPEPPRII